MRTVITIETNKHEIRVKHKIQLSSGKSDVKRTVIKQNSNKTHILVISLYDNEGQLMIDDGWNIVISAKKSDNKFIVDSNNISVSENEINVVVTQQMLTTPGTERCELAIYKEDGTCYFSDTFLIYVEQNINHGSELESINEYDSIVDTLNQIKEYEKEAEKTKDHIQDVSDEADEMLENMGETLVSAVEVLSETEPEDPIQGSFWLKEY